MPKDILLDSSFDLMIKNGDIVVDDSTEQNQVLLFMSHPGEWRQHPTIGVGAQDFVNDDNFAMLAQEIQKQFQEDGMQVKKVTVMETGKTQWDAEYNY